MSVGLPITKGEIDQQAGSIARSVFNVLSTVGQFKAWLDGVSAQDLESVYGYTSGEAAVLKSAFGDLAELASVFNNGTPTHTEAHDFRAFARQLIGTGLY